MMASQSSLNTIPVRVDGGTPEQARWRLVSGEYFQTLGVGPAIGRLFNAADEDSATGGPDLVRGIYPTMATITDRGFEKIADEEIAQRFRLLVDRLSVPESTSTVGPSPTMDRGEQP